MDIMDEMIADARAEEEVRKAQIEAKLAETKKDSTKVSIDLEEYVVLRMAYKDYKQLVDSIFKGCRYYTYGADISINEDKTVMTLLRLNFPEMYVETLMKLKAEKEAEDSE